MTAQSEISNGGSDRLGRVQMFMAGAVLLFIAALAGAIGAPMTALLLVGDADAEGLRMPPVRSADADVANAEFRPFAPSLPDCRGSGNCPAVAINVSGADYEAFHRRLQLAAVNHGGGYDLVSDPQRGRSYLMQLPRDAVAGLRELDDGHALTSAMPYAQRALMGRAGHDYQQWAYRWSNGPAATGAADDLAAVSVSVRSVERFYVLGPVLLAIAAVAAGYFVLLAWLRHRKINEEVSP